MLHCRRELLIILNCCLCLLVCFNLRLQALFLNMWEHFEQGDGLFSKDGLHLNKRGAAVLGKGFLRALGDGIGKLSLN